MNSYYKEAEAILLEGSGDSLSDIQMVLEDAENPLRRKTLDKLYQSVRDKGHVDFGYIEKSEGAIQKYTGYDSMVDTLTALSELGAADIQASKEFTFQVNTVRTAISNIVSFAPLYKLAFIKQCQPIILEYNAFVAACVEATTSLLFTFVDYTKDPQSGEVAPIIKNNKMRADLFYIEQLSAFNATVEKGSYKKYLTTVVNNGSEYFLGVDDAVVVGGVALVTAVALSIVPVTRKLLYTFQDARRKLSDALELQAYYLELNRSVLEANETMSKEKKDKVLKKQEALRLKFLRLADKLRVDSKRNQELSKKDLDKDNGMLTLDGMRDEIDNSDIVLI